MYNGQLSLGLSFWRQSLRFTDIVFLVVSLSRGRASHRYTSIVKKLVKKAANADWKTNDINGTLKPAQIKLDLACMSSWLPYSA